MPNINDLVDIKTPVDEAQTIKTNAGRSSEEG